MGLRMVRLCLQLCLLATVAASSGSSHELSRDHSRWLTDKDTDAADAEVDEDATDTGRADAEQGADEEGEEGEKGEEGEEGEKGEEEEKIDAASLTAAILLMAFVFLISTLFVLVNHKDEHIRANTWLLISNSISIFCAVAFYQGLDSLLDDAFDDPSLKSQRIIVSGLHFIVWYVAVQAFCLVTLSLMDKRCCGRQSFEAGCCIGAHFCGFAAQDTVIAIMSHPDFRGSLGLAAVAILIMVCLFGLFISVAFCIRKCCVYPMMERRHINVDVDESEDAIGDAENDMFGLSVGFACSMFLRFAVHGKMPTDEMDEPDYHEQWEAWTLFGLSYAYMIIPILCLQCNIRCSLFDEEMGNPYAVRFLEIFKLTCLMTKAWCILYWGKWEILDTQLEKWPVIACATLAMMVTYYGVLLLLLASCIMRISHMKGARRSSRLIVQGIGLAVAFAWEATFDKAVEDVSEADEVEVSEAGMKLILTGVLVSTVGPAWFLYVLPKGLEAEEILNKEQKSDLTAISDEPKSRDVALEGSTTEKDDGSAEQKEEKASQEKPQNVTQAIGGQPTPTQDEAVKDAQETTGEHLRWDEGFDAQGIASKSESPDKEFEQEVMLRGGKIGKLNESDMTTSASIRVVDEQDEMGFTILGSDQMDAQAVAARCTCCSQGRCTL